MPVRAPSSTVATAVATAVIMLATLFSFSDEPAGRAVDLQLRGTIAPNDAGGGPAQLPADRKRA